MLLLLFLYLKELAYRYYEVKSFMENCDGYRVKTLDVLPSPTGNVIVNTTKIGHSKLDKDQQE